jgi:hypothetical protein
MRVFLSYRRDDSSPWTGRLRDALAARFGDDGVFQDVTGVRPGLSFDEEIASALARADATLAVIGPRWLSATGHDGRRRLDDENDHVRRELVQALASQVPTIPVLVGGARLPDVDELPDVLRPLVSRQAVELRDESWHDDVARLARSLPGADHDQEPRSRRWRFVGAVAVAVAMAAAVVGVLLASGDGEGDNTVSDDDAVDDTTQVMDGYIGTGLPTCETPRPPAWADLEASGAETGGDGRAWRLALVGAHARPADTGWDVVIDLAGTNEQEGSMWFDGDVALVSGGRAWNPTCFGVVSGDTMVSPGATSRALVGFGPDEAPAGAISVDVDDDGERYRLDVDLGAPAE